VEHLLAVHSKKATHNALNQPSAENDRIILAISERYGSFGKPVKRFCLLLLLAVRLGVTKSRSRYSDAAQNANDFTMVSARALEKIK
jgi:hypothetical protein